MTALRLIAEAATLALIWALALYGLPIVVAAPGVGS